MTSRVWLFVLPFLLGFSLREERSKEFQSLSRRAKLALEGRRWNEALATLEEAKRKFSHSAKVRLSLSYLYREIGLLQQARENAEWAQKHMIKDKDWAERELAWVYFKMTLYEDALDALSRIKDKISSDGALAARIWMAKGEYEKACPLLDPLDGYTPQIAFWKGWCSWMKGDMAQAKSILADSHLDLSRKIFGSLDLSREKDPWVILAAVARQAAEHNGITEIAAIQQVKALTDRDPAHVQAWEMIQEIRR